MRHKFHRLIILIGITLILLPSSSEAIKIVSWNILDFPGTTGASREEYFRKVVEQLDADILVVQEMLSQAGVNQFLNKVMNFSSPKVYKAVPFFDGPDSDNALFYKKKILKLISRQQITTSLRDISEYVFKIKKGPGKGAMFRIYSVHLKEGNSSKDKKERKEEATILRDYLNGLPPNSLFLICGTFNMRSDKEAVIFTGTQSDNDGRSKDPINNRGKWNKKKFAKFHTESTRKSPYGGGASGGLNDRYDMIFISDGFDNNEKLTYKTDSYIVYGNDGKHFNKSINKGKNKAVSKDMAKALYESSDHLPVIIELEPPSATITITNPTKDTVWVAGDQVTIQWKTSSSSSLNISALDQKRADVSVASKASEVKIDLYEDGNFKAVIASKAPDTGQYSWQIPIDTGSGNDYKIGISVVGEPNICGESENFDICYDVSGTYKGTMEGTIGGSPFNTDITYTQDQNGRNVSGPWTTTAGYSGTMEGTIDGSIINIIVTLNGSAEKYEGTMEIENNGDRLKGSFKGPTQYGDIDTNFTIDRQ